jgi:hypothetical protein
VTAETTGLTGYRVRDARPDDLATIVAFNIALASD